jgi:hypothetical protein
MLTMRQQLFVKRASQRAADAQLFEAFVTDVTAGKRGISARQLRAIVDARLRMYRSQRSGVESAQPLNGERFTGR